MWGTTNFTHLLMASTFVKGLLDVLQIIMVIGNVGLTVYAVYLAFLMMTASDAQKRAKAKKRIWTAGSSIMIILLLIGVLAGVNTSMGGVDSGSSSSNNNNTGSNLGITAPPSFKMNFSCNPVSGTSNNAWKVTGSSFDIKPSDFNGRGSEYTFKSVSDGSITYGGGTEIGKQITVSNVGDHVYVCFNKGNFLMIYGDQQLQFPGTNKSSRVTYFNVKVKVTSDIGSYQWVTCYVSISLTDFGNHYVVKEG